MLKQWNFTFRRKCFTPKGTFLPPVLGPKNKLETRTIIQETLVMSVGIAIIKHTEKVSDFLPH